jgi:4-diphosphocytidyl-2-C-methyl-D-erythritol kinase
VLRELAYAKLNLVLHVGRPRDDGMHPICSLVASIDLADEITVEQKTSGEDTVECLGVAGDNLAARALAEFRSRAGGLGGGSADAAATLRIANRLAGDPLAPEELVRLAADLGSDVPAQLEPGHALVQGTGERVEHVSVPPFFAVLLPDRNGLSTAAVYSELDRLDAARGELDPEPLRRLAASPLAEIAASLDNDLQGAALSLRPELRERLDALAAARAFGAAVSGSGPTCFGLFPDRSSAEAAVSELPGALVTELR